MATAGVEDHPFHPVDGCHIEGFACWPPNIHLFVCLLFIDSYTVVAYILPVSKS